MKLTWYSAGTDEPRDEQTDLMSGYWVVIGPDGKGGYDWTVVGPDGEDFTSGTAADADAAKAAVSEWDRQVVDYSTGRTAIPPAGFEDSEVQP